MQKKRRRKRVSGWLAGMAAVAVGGLTYASNGTGQSDGTAGLKSGEVLIVEEKDDAYWRLKEDANAKRVPRYPRGLFQEGIEGCVNVGFVIQPDGVPGGFRLLKVVSSQPSSRKVRDQFASALIEVLKRRRYEPGTENPQRLPGFASEDADFAIGGGREGRPCQIKDLGVFLRERRDSSAP